MRVRGPVFVQAFLSVVWQKCVDSIHAKCFVHPQYARMHLRKLPAHKHTLAKPGLSAWSLFCCVGQGAKGKKKNAVCRTQFF